MKSNNVILTAINWNYSINLNTSLITLIIHLISYLLLDTQFWIYNFGIHTLNFLGLWIIEQFNFYWITTCFHNSTNILKP